jgi:hypothetical protein
MPHMSNSLFLLCNSFLQLHFVKKREIYIRQWIKARDAEGEVAKMPRRTFPLARGWGRG